MNLQFFPVNENRFYKDCPYFRGVDWHMFKCTTTRKPLSENACNRHDKQQLLVGGIV